MKPLVAYYSKTGNTRTVAQMISKAAAAEMEEVHEIGAKRNGIIGFLRSGRDGMTGAQTKIEQPQQKPSDYDLIFIGTPVWGWNLVPAIRTYLSAVDVDGLPVALFCTMGSSGDDKAFSSMRTLLPSSQILGELAVSQREIRDGQTLGMRVKRWVREIESLMPAST